MRRYDIWSSSDGTLNACHDQVNGNWVAYEDAQAAIKAAVEAERAAVVLLAQSVMTACGLCLAEREYIIGAIRARSKQ